MTSERYASPDDAADLVEHWSSAVLLCRSYGHPWQPQRATWNPHWRTYLTVQICPRCHGERHAELNERGHPLATWIRYPEGYLSKGSGRIVGDAKDVIRLAAVLQSFDVKRLRNSKAAQEAEPRSKAARDALREAS